MPHVVPAASQLLTEIKNTTGKKATVLGDVDGLGFQRSIRMSPEVAKALGDDVITALEGDARIEEVVKSAQGTRVTFVADTRADYTDEFGLAEVVAQ